MSLQVCSRIVKALSVLCLLLSTMPLRAQFDTAEVLGRIDDGSGSTVGKATITLKNQGTGIEAQTETDESGNYTFSNVKIGKYSVSAEAKGFSKSIASDVQVNVNARQRVNLTLQLGAVSQSIEVSGAASVLQTDSSERGQVISTAQVVDLPLNGRAYSDLALLTNGVVRSPSASSGTPREGSFVVNGLRSVFNNYMLDGIDNNAYGTSNQGFANQAIQPSPDAVSEFKVVTNNYSAEYGRSGGATINTATRSGTNEFHGTAYNFLRNTALNANGYVFGQRPATFQKQGLQQNQFGGTIGGPIIKNKVFFFADYEGFRRLGRTLTFSNIPTLNDRAGILPVAVRNPLTGVLYPANTRLPVTAISPFAQRVLNDLPAPTSAGRSNNFQQNLLERNYSDKWDGKIDGQITDTMSGFIRLSQRKVNIFNAPPIAGPSGGGANGNTRVLNQQAEASYTWAVSPTSILEARFAVTRTNAGKQPPFLGAGNMLSVYGIPGLPTDPQIAGGLVTTTISGFAQLGRQATNPQFQNPLNFDPKVNFSKNFGKQSLKVGYEFLAIRTQVLDVNPLYGNDTYAGLFSRPTTTSPADNASYALADFFFGIRNQYQLANSVVGNYRQHEHFLYVQDDYRISSKLTVNLGLRWEYATPRWERDNVLSNFDPTTNTIIRASSGSIYNRALVDPDRNNFAPRIGFAYSVMPKTVIRGGYGISYIHQNRLGSADLLGINGPQTVIATINQTPTSPNFVPSAAGYPVGLATPANFRAQDSNITYIPRGWRSPYVQSWFFSVQREIMKNTVLDVAYVGNHSVGIPAISDFNQASPQPSPTANLGLNARRPIQGFGAITWLNPAGFSNYNSLQVKAERRFSSGLSFLNSFTWSKAIDNSGLALDTSNGNAASPQNVRNLAAEKGVSNYDQTLANITSVNWQIPYGRGRRFGSSTPGVVDQLLGGWELTGVNTALSSPPINLRSWATVPAAFQTVGNLADFRGGESYRPNVSGPVVAADSVRNTDNYFNRANVSLPTDPSQPFGNAGRNAIRATPLNQLDLAVHKDFRLPFENGRMQFRSEFFNIFNKTNFQAANPELNSPAFGTIRSTFPPRQIQFALKLIF